jgi:hypothetical protein
VAAPVPLVYIAASTIFLLGSAQRQVDCFRSAADALDAGGWFVVEAALPATVTAQDRQFLVQHVDDDHVRLTVQIHDPLTQRVMSQEIRLEVDGTWRILPALKRYASPAELDLMAQLAGLRLHARYDGWDQAPLTARSTRHVSIYQRHPAGIRRRLGRLRRRRQPP